MTSPMPMPAPPLRVLTVLAEPPLPEGGATGRCVLARLRGLQAHGVEVTTVAARQIFSQPGEPPADVRLQMIDVVPPATSWETRINRLRTPRGELGRGEFASRVRELARQADVVHLEQVDTAWCDEGITAPSLVQLNFLVRRDRSVTRLPDRQWRDTIELILAERATIRRHRWLAANSPAVADALHHAAPSAEVILAPLCVDPRYYRLAALDGPPVAGLIGTANWPTTAASMRRLLTRVWPLVLRRVPTARLRLAGRGVEALVGRSVPPGVEIAGEVDSSAKFLAGLSLLLYPIERGSGMKVKTLEAIVVGLPVVTTSVGTEGIDGGDGIVVESDDHGLAMATAELLMDQGARQQRGRAARAAFECRYTPEAATVPLVDAYRRMAAAGTPR